MNAERYRRPDQLFQSARDLDPAQRAAYLDDACAGDTDLRAEVEALIKSYEQAGSFLQSPLMEPVEAEYANTFLGKSFGPYKVISHLGSGGMGVVYLAEDRRLSRKGGVTFSRDGKKIVCSRRVFSRDAILISDVRVMTITAITNLYKQGKLCRAGDGKQRPKDVEQRSASGNIARAVGEFNG